MRTFGTRGRDIEEDESTEQRRHDEGGPWYTQAIYPSKYLRCLPLSSQTVQRARGNVQIGVGSAEYEEQNAAIDDVV